MCDNIVSFTTGRGTEALFAALSRSVLNDERFRPHTGKSVALAADLSDALNALGEQDEQADVPAPPPPPPLPSQMRLL
eukprot:3179465-Alexandrium_andersonii.AAC.1